MASSTPESPTPARRPTGGLYAGDGSTMGQRGVGWPPVVDRVRLTDPAGYIADAALVDAVNVALTLQQPLLVTGEPGTGKTQLAASIAHELQLPPPIRFDTKSGTTVRDLFYAYDALRHFHDAHFRATSTDVRSYIEFAALGVAILLATDPEEADRHLPGPLRGRGPTRAVVLIDEIDKAPRDVPNDMLNELENMSFSVKETGDTFAADPALRPVVVITSNSEKALPDAFLRRCVFYHIPFPDRDRLRAIVQARLGADGDFGHAKLEHALDHFEEIRTLNLRKPPATAELLEWLSVLRMHDVDVRNPRPGERDLVAVTYSILAKSRQDLDMLRSRL